MVKRKQKGREGEHRALEQDGGMVRGRDYSSVMLCSMRENQRRINSSRGDEGFTRCNILQITSHHSELHLDINPNLNRTASFSFHMSCIASSSSSSSSHSASSKQSWHKAADGAISDAAHD